MERVVQSHRLILFHKMLLVAIISIVTVITFTTCRSLLDMPQSFCTYVFDMMRDGMLGHPTQPTTYI
jgi:hypothetical protein